MSTCEHGVRNFCETCRRWMCEAIEDAAREERERLAAAAEAKVEDDKLLAIMRRAQKKHGLA